ncbi:hypothetical protein GIV66_08755 [Pseudomonas sp. PA-3-11C]|uniref:hypothetical protein n=1 Tax=unclassified Pseudomonas TaxID=196821 RepID=UPI0003573EFD|nr:MULTISPECIES: hypothetical protein [unclassified Pseudomonas]OKP70122.1 hypothetical protein BTR19_15385 [Pseudomonas fluorescens]EPJ76079.1 hypothetical protein CFT9_27071 [Pseudomonas sp. CFT9]MCF5510511.1 hypothetical protein [Pseudomonas sp. PA-3-6H]MCF5515930.1 hypothetical protein [Pseudomonas sp. PA-3-6E]MCF5560812.1 hypothetical protein [Pseudomonas sp. PA-3-5D]
MSSQPLTKKNHARQFAELMAEAGDKMSLWASKVAEQRAASDAGKPDDLILEATKLDADEDYKIGLFNLHQFLVLTSYAPPQRGK